MSSGSQESEIVQLYQDTSDELRRLLVRKLGNRAEAEEIAHDAYLKLFRIEHKEDIRDLRRYLFTVSVRLALNVLRKRKYESRFLAYESSSMSHDAGLDRRSAYSILLAELKLEAIKGALTQLPEKTRFIFLQHRFEGLTYAQIASSHDVTTKAVEYHMRRALEAVSVAVDELEEMDG